MYQPKHPFGRPRKTLFALPGCRFAAFVALPSISTAPVVYEIDRLLSVTRYPHVPLPRKKNHPIRHAKRVGCPQRSGGRTLEICCHLPARGLGKKGWIRTLLLGCRLPVHHQRSCSAAGIHHVLLLVAAALGKREKVQKALREGNGMGRKKRTGNFLNCLWVALFLARESAAGRAGAE
jgi:hypothetical protein